VTLYLDTSSLVKLYIDEEGSDAVKDLVEQASTVATSAVAFAEARAVFARHRSLKLISPIAYSNIVRRFDLDWTSMLIVDVSEAVLRSAGALADRLSVRGFDAIHLASFEGLLPRAEDAEVHFSSADVRLANAAKKLG
jgi:predicted nucleic acid-binding protein